MTAAPPQQKALADVTAAIDRLGARRSHQKWVAGVCDGAALRMGIDPVVLRVAVIVLTLFGGLGVAIYAAGWLLLPAPEGPSVLQRTAVRAGNPTAALAVLGLVAAVLVVTTLNLFSGGGWWPSQLVLVLVVGGALYAGVRHSHRTPPGIGAPGAAPFPPPPPSNAPGVSWPADVQVHETSTEQAPIEQASTFQAYTLPYPPTTGSPTVLPTQMAPAAVGRPRRPRVNGWVALSLLGVAASVATGVSLVHAAAGWAGNGPTVGLAAALGVIALVLVGAGLSGRRGGLTTLLALVLAAGTGISAIGTDRAWVGGIGDRQWSATGVGAQGYRLGLGSATLDLRDVPDQAPGGQPLRVPVRIGLGELTVILPERGTVTLTSDIAAGAVFLDDARVADGSPLRDTRTFGTGSPTLLLTLQMGAGDLRITRPGS